jgi:hypothetical protein
MTGTDPVRAMSPQHAHTCSLMPGLCGLGDRPWHRHLGPLSRQSNA